MKKKAIKKKIKKTISKSKTKKKVIRPARPTGAGGTVKKPAPSPTKSFWRGIAKRGGKKIVDKKSKQLKRFVGNPIIHPSSYSWESQAVFNPAAISMGEKIHLFYRALGDDGISRIGYASSSDGINFYERIPYPVFSLKEAEESKKHWPFTSPARPVYDRTLYSSGGGWGGCEDPRAVLIDGYLYLTFNVFNGWDSMSVAVVSIKEEDLLNKKWIWQDFSYLSHPGDRQKNWVLFPEKINGKFAIFHNLDKGDPTRVFISYVNKLDTSETPTIKDAPDPQTLPDHIVAWHKRTRSAAAPPIKTKDGWLLLYHAMDKDDGDRYKLGAMLLDLKDPTKVLYRAKNPILEPDLWYENHWKPGIIYANGAVVKDGTLFVYYGGGDKYVAVAYIKLSDLINSIKSDGIVKLSKVEKLNLS